MKKQILKTLRPYSIALAVAASLAPIQSHAANATWVGGTDGNWNVDANWNPAAAPGSTSIITSPDTALFNAASANTTITIDLNRNIKAIDFDTAAAAYTIGSAGVNGGNSLLLSNNASNSTGLRLLATFAGTNTIQTINAPIVLEPATATTAGSAGFLNSATATNALRIAGDITGGTTTSTYVLTLNGTNTNVANELSGVISNGGVAGGLSITKTNNGLWNLSNANSSFTGAVTVSAGTLAAATIANSGVNSSIGAGSSILLGGNNGTTLRINGAGGTTNRSIIINTATTAAAANAQTLDSSGTGTVTVTSNVTTASNSATATANVFGLGGTNTGANLISGNIVDFDATHIVAINKTGAGSWNLTGNNTYTGTTTLTAGTLNLGSSTAIGAGQLVFAGNATFDNTSGAAFTKAVTGITLNGSPTFTGTSSLNLGTGNVGLGTAAGGTRTITVTANTLSIGGIQNGTNATPTTQFTKTGAGILEINGNSSNSGTTIVNAGTFLQNGSHTGAGAYSLTGSGIIGGGGSITTAGNLGVTMASGTKLTPGAAASLGTLTADLGTGTFSIGGAVTPAASASMLFDLSSTGTNDKLLLSNAGSVLSIGNGVLNFDDFVFTLSGTLLADTTYTLFDTSNAIVGSLGANLTGTVGGNNATLSSNGQDIFLTVVAVPEPSTYVMLLGGVATLFLLQKRRRSL